MKQGTGTHIEKKTGLKKGKNQMKQTCRRLPHGKSLIHVDCV